MSYLPAGAVEGDLSAIRERLDALAKQQKEETSARKWALFFGGMGALFAAVRLGLIAIPAARRKKKE